MGSKPNREQRLLRLGEALMVMIHNVVDSAELAARRGNLHPTDLSCISYLRGRGEPVSPKEIISALRLSSGSGTALFDRLERAGYVHRIPNPSDRRSILIVLDQEAASSPLSMLRGLQERYVSGLEGYTERELDVIAEYLERVAAMAVDARRPDHGAELTAKRLE